MTKTTNDGNTLTISFVRHGLLLSCLEVWMIFWTVGGLMAVGVFLLVSHPLVVLWAKIWALSWLVGVFLLSAMTTGKQVLRVVDQNIEVIHKFFGIPFMRRVFAGLEVCDVRVSRGNEKRVWFVPYFTSAVFGWSGMVRFAYKSQIHYLAPGMSIIEAGQVVDWLKKRLPADD